MKRLGDIKVWLIGLIFGGVCGTFLLGVVSGVAGNALYSQLTFWISSNYFKMTHVRQIEAQKVGLNELIAGDDAYQTGDLISASKYYDLAMENLEFSASGGDAQAMTLLALIYHCGREPFVSQDQALYAYWKSKAEELNETYARNVGGVCQN